ncbi:hypothetical protein TBLA_0A02420 [Henningerozyma blattae CBS 6284]|uniref:Autophagy-related protein 3 n=1 Tax=Henningerozyma blattae (strain ATCC 34711 / CBS 6284 / DSM 70876 / NBRC 10599 / NRRL Y-10934 / UCD 77-7) TaxID=1071380 RepID=I2GV89_HENB6|nr:hypothetical protein TBLA_0A02420 [Tetrapisispora blattae CBS 6284]CCH58041.1 hypothetical protein TBLA_0A02420 [Tetrapisispora blattae CBS 6284]
MIRSKLSSWREYWTPVTNTSTFQTTGQITPNEFVKAGDYLTSMFPTWYWNKATNDVSFRDFLPKDRQFLVSRKVVCNKRAPDSANNTTDGLTREIIIDSEINDGKSDEDGWLLEETISKKPEGTDSQSNAKIDQSNEKNLHSNSVNAAPLDIDEMMKGMALEDGEEDDIVEVPVDSSRRYYDLYITYSTSYRTPKMYIVGFNNDGSPLTPDQMFEDISPDYRTKTATIEKLPFLKKSIPSVSIHPCKHANVMKILFDRIRLARQNRRKQEEENAKATPTDLTTTDVTTTTPSHATTLPEENSKEDGWEDLQDDINDSLRVDQYLIVFLKFITSVTPSIEHDYTMEGW